MGGAERSWRTLFDMARCLLINSQLPKKLWNHAVRTAAYIRNRCYSDRLKCTPIEKFTGEKPNINNMHVFGATCFAYIQDKSKLDPRADKGRFIGYDPYSPCPSTSLNEGMSHDHQLVRSDILQVIHKK